MHLFSLRSLALPTAVAFAVFSTAARADGTPECNATDGDDGIPLTADDGLECGVDANAASRAVAVGTDADAQGAGSVVIGAGGAAPYTNSVALGAGSTTFADDTVSVGNMTLRRRLTNVAAGIDGSDAVSKSQLDAVAATAVNPVVLAVKDAILVGEIATQAIDTNLDGRSVPADIGQIYLGNTADSADAITIDSGTNFPGGIAFRRYLGAASDPQQVTAGTQLGYLDFRGYSEAFFYNAGSLDVVVDPSRPYSSGLMPTKMRFAVSDGTRVFIPMELTSSGRLELGAVRGTSYFGAGALGDPQLYVYQSSGYWNTILSSAADGGPSYVLRLHSGGATGSDYLIGASSGAGTGTFKFSVRGNGDTYVAGGLFVQNRDVLYQIDQLAATTSSASAELSFFAATGDAMGTDPASANAADATAIGNGAHADAEGSIALGAASVANAANTVSVGNDMLQRRIINVADGVSASDAATLGQLTATQTALQGQIDSNTSAIVQIDARVSGLETQTGANTNTISAYGQRLGAAEDRIDANESNIAELQSIATGNAAELTYFASSGIGSAQAANNATAVGAGANAGGVGALAFGNGANATGGQATAIGNNSVGTGVNALALGNVSRANGTAAIAIGDSAIASSPNSSATGSQALATAPNATAYGAAAKALRDSATASGYNALAQGAMGTSIGTAAIVTADNGTALGAGARVSQANSTAVGAGAKTTAANQVMIGTRTTSVVVAGIDASTQAQQGPVDVVTVDANGTLGRQRAASAQSVEDVRVAMDYISAVSDTQYTALSDQVQSLSGRVDQLGFRLEDLDRSTSGGIATAIAMGGMMVVPDSTVSLSVNASTYRGEQGFSGGITARVAEKVYVSGSIGGSTVKSSTGGRVGMAIGF